MRRILPLLVALSLPGLALAAPKPAAKPAQRPATRPKPPPAPPPQKGAKPGPDKPADGPRVPDAAARRSIAGGPTAEEAQRGAESPELRTLREIEREMFPPAAPRVGAAWPSEAPLPVPIDADKPAVHASGLPPVVDPKKPAGDAANKDESLAWVRALKVPDLPVKWDARVVSYLQYFRDDPRGRAMAHVAWKRSGRYGEEVKRALRKERVPEALLWLAMTESAFDPAARSHAGAVGQFQFMPDGARIYGLRVDRWIDERLDPSRSTEGAAKYLSDLERRFGSWEMALAAYNMGFGGLLAAVKKYNTNDYWELSKHEAGIPWETTLYVPKITAFAIVAENPAVFGLEALPREAPVAFDTVDAPPGLSLASVAKATGATPKLLADLNPHLRAKRTPIEGDEKRSYALHVPPGAGDALKPKLTTLAAQEPKLFRVTVRTGQTVDMVADELGVSVHALRELNGLTAADMLRGGDVLLAPPGGGVPRDRPRAVVVTPAEPTSLPNRRRVFYRVIPGDTLKMVGAAFKVSVDDLRAWNAVDPAGRLQEGMTLQVFVDPAQDLSNVLFTREEDAEILVVGTEKFFEYFEAQKGRRRITITVGPGDDWKTISRKYGISVGMLERINRKGRSTPLAMGEKIVVYTGKSDVPLPKERGDDAAVTGPAADDLPALPQRDDAPRDP